MGKDRKIFAALFCFLFGLMLPSGSLVYAERAGDADSAQQPRLVVPSATYDFGTVEQGEKIDHFFTIRNTGSGPLKIEHLHASCGCMAAVVSSDTIAPGEDSSMKVTFDTTGFQGQKIKTVRFYTNDSSQPSMLLSMRGIVQPDVKASVEKIDFGKVSKGQTPEKSFIVSALPKSGVQITEASSHSGNVEVISDSDSAAGAPSKKFRLRLKSTLPVGIFRDRVTVKTTSKTNPVVNVAVFADIQGDLRAEPPAVTFGLLTGPLEQPVTKTVRVFNRGSQAVRILGVESDSTNVAAELRAGAVAEMRTGETRAGSSRNEPQGSKSAGGTEVVLTIQPDVMGAFRATVKVKTNHADPEQQELLIPVYGIVTRGNS